MATKPLIGINGDFRPARKETIALSWFNTGYYDSVVTAGGLPALIPPLAEDRDLKQYLKADGAGGDALVSPNDGKPVVIVPGVAMDATPAEGERSIVAYERTGVNGKRMMVDVRGMVHIVSDNEFATIKFVGGHKPK